jgi:nucleoside-diphosphate-sugar epimerase
VADLGQPIHAYQPLPGRIVAMIHCAAAIPSRSNSFDENVHATTRLCAKLAQMCSVDRVIHLSSVAVYKAPPRGLWIISEDAELVDIDDPNTSPYAGSKRASELALDTFAQQHPEVRLVHLRASSVYGRGMVPTTLLPVLVTRALQHEPIQLGGPRGYVQNFVHVEDVAELAITLLTSDDRFYAVNAFSEDTYGLAALAHFIRDELRSTSSIIDNTNSAESPAPVFVNVLARRLQPRFRNLRDYVLDVA